MAACVLLSGFKPFGEIAVNPTEKLMEVMAQSREPLPAQVQTVVLDTAYQLCEEQLRQEIERFAPDAVLCFGLRFDADKLNLERFAVNVDDANIADTMGTQRNGQRIVESGPAAYWTTLPIEEMAAALTNAGIPARISNHAGAYVCNHVFYYGRHLVETGQHKPLLGFIHVPPFPEQLEEESTRQGMDLETLTRAARICVAIVAEYVGSGKQKSVRIVANGSG